MHTDAARPVSGMRGDEMHTLLAFIYYRNTQPRSFMVKAPGVAEVVGAKPVVSATLGVRQCGICGGKASSMLGLTA